MKTAFIVCSRIGSSRLPEKVFRQVNGQMLIDNLVERLCKTEIPVILAVPHGEESRYEFLKRNHGIDIFVGDSKDPLKRMSDAAKEFGVDHVIRVTHDKVFIDPDLVYKALGEYHKGNFDYLSSGEFCDGSAFEIIKAEGLHNASSKYDNIEFIGYAIKSITKNVVHFSVPDDYKSDCRFLVDYPDDLLMIETLFTELGNDCSLIDAIKFCESNPKVKWINRLPEVTVYTCAYNDQTYIREAMRSVKDQTMWPYMEYILVDDCSTDSTLKEMVKFKVDHPNVRIIKNQFNVGLASSSNIALKQARGRYIIRLDADDFFSTHHSINKLIHKIQEDNYDVVYPNYYDGAVRDVKKGDVNHHPGGALFNTRALNHVKFTDSLRNYDGYDLYVRAKDQMKIGYLNTPTFFYRHTPGSMSRTNLEERAKTKSVIDELTL